MGEGDDGRKSMDGKKGRMREGKHGRRDGWKKEMMRERVWKGKSEG